MTFPTTEWLVGNKIVLMSGELGSLANNAVAVGPAFNNSQGNAGSGFMYADVQLEAIFAGSPAANTGVNLYFLESQDGVNFENLTVSGLVPNRAPDLVFPVYQIANPSGQRINLLTQLPWGTWKPMIYNNGTGQAFIAQSSVLSIRPATIQLPNA